MLAAHVNQDGRWPRSTVGRVPNLKSPVASMNRRKTPSPNIQRRKTGENGRSGEYDGVNGCLYPIHTKWIVRGVDACARAVTASC